MRAALRLAVIGCGEVATTCHLPAIVALAVVCDTDADRARRAMEAFGAGGWTTDAKDRLADDIDAVIVATPPWTTPRLTIDALLTRKDVLCEKPMALSLDDALAVQVAEHRSDRFVQVGFVLRHGPMFSTLRRWIADDWLGGPLSLRISVFDELWQPETNPEHYGRIMRSLEHGAPCIHDGAHTMDHLHYLLGDQVTRLTAWGRSTGPESPRPNLNTAVMEFAAGRLARVEIGWFLPTFPPSEWFIAGPKGIAWFDQGAGRVELRAESGGETVALPGGDAWFTSCFRHQLDTFLSAVRTRVPAQPGTKEGIASLALTQAFERGMCQPWTI
jgi:myo-inositol 2-dehydrogenase / D-chiro-inositol 1-dehydrogenase